MSATLNFGVVLSMSVSSGEEECYLGHWATQKTLFIS